MKGKAKLVRYGDGKYHVFVRNHFWNRWKPLKDDNGENIACKNFEEFTRWTRIESFDIITLTFDQFSGLGRE